MKQLLIISPHFPPTNAPDHQRVRMALPYLRNCGWNPEVLAVAPSAVAAPIDAWLLKSLPADVAVHRVEALSLRWSRVPGLGNLHFRALGAMRRKGDELLALKKFDLVYFSTTQFGVHVLGPRWKRKFGVPFVMDYQDPWVTDYYAKHPEITPPGGRFKYNLSQRLSRRQEPRVLRQCAGITSVSADYPRQLRARYHFLPRDFPTAILPFPGDEADLKRAAADGARQSIFDPKDGKRHWVYVGVCIPGMAPALRAIFSALQNLARVKPDVLKQLKMHFIGTSYAAAGQGQKTVEPIAKEFGFEEVVSEHTDRIPFAQALRCLLDADALVVPGSNDAGYTASKIYPYILAKKPLLAVFHAESSVVNVLQQTRAGTVVTFQNGDPVEATAQKIVASGWLQNPTVPATDWLAFEPYTAREMTRKLCALFDEVCKAKAKC